MAVVVGPVAAVGFVVEPVAEAVVGVVVAQVEPAAVER